MNLLGMHDAEGKALPPSSGWCLNLVELKSNPQPLDYRNLRSDINWLVRVDWSQHGEGTYTQPHEMEKYLDAAIPYILACRGAWGFIIGNEPNHEVEGNYPAAYTAQVFRTVRDAVKRHNSNLRLLTPGIAPYQLNSMRFAEEMFKEIGHADGIAIHAYTRSSNPSDISSSAKMDAPLSSNHSGFRTYRDVLATVPSQLKSTPALITEFDELDGWEDANRGIFPAVARELQEWNAGPGNQRVISCVAYRWPKFDRWWIEGKNGVIEDFRSAFGQAEIKDEPAKVFIPDVGTGTPTPKPQPAYNRSIEQDAVNYGVRVTPFDSEGLKDGDLVWVAERVERLSESEAQGNRHFYFDTVDEQGVRLLGIPVYTWNGGPYTAISEPKPGEKWSCNRPFTPGKNAFSAYVNLDSASDTVTGAGMGEDTPSGFNPGIHSCITVKWVRHRYSASSTPPVQKPVDTTMPKLQHPVLDANARRITQVFGVNGDYYKRFSVDGVPLRGHNGIDFGTPVGTPIGAVAYGKVVEVANDPTGYGNYVKLSHLWGESLYAHLSQAYVNVGQQVRPGQLLGNSGNTGNSTGPHLHFGLRVSPFNRKDGWGGYKDPLPYLQQGDDIDPVPVPPSDVLGAIKQAARELGMDWELLASLAWAESSFDPLEENGGLMQVGDDAWSDWAGTVGAADIDSPLDNAKVGGAYLRWLLQRYNGNIYKALWAYNAGPSRVDKGDVPAISKEYSNKVVHGRDLLKAIGA